MISANWNSLRYVDEFQDFVFLHGIGLVDNERTGIDFLQDLCDMALSCSDEVAPALPARRESSTSLTFFLGTIDHVLARLIFSPCELPGVSRTRSVLVTRINSLDAVAGGLRFLGCNRNLLSDQVVHQRGFSTFGRPIGATKPDL